VTKVTVASIFGLLVRLPKKEKLQCVNIC